MEYANCPVIEILVEDNNDGTLEATAGSSDSRPCFGRMIDLGDAYLRSFWVEGLEQGVYDMSVQLRRPRHGNIGLFLGCVFGR